jgi:prepilin-type N-terminal cleavage/methylation domain-containing protein
MRGHNGFTLIELMVVVLILGLLAAIIIPNYLAMQYRAREASVKYNSHTVQLAAEDFAMMNRGVYPMDHDTHTTPDGLRMLDLLPGGEPLENPFTRERTEPVTAAQAANEGEIAYSPIIQGGVGVGYMITGAGRAGVIVITLAGGR